ncbi:MAG: hypothetical protein H7328_03680 [Bdellovibrio sp.]|nr:hypothetical protein [Bdellovibrio sp.]
MKSVIAVFILAFTLNSEAQLRCFGLFTRSAEHSPPYYANAIDHINNENNHFIYKKDLRDSIIAETENRSFSARTKARWQSYRLRSKLKELKSANSWDRYDFEVFAKRLEQLSFLDDPNITKDMSPVDKILYQQTRHSLLAKGLQKYLFDNISAPPGIKMKVFNWIMLPFKDIYSRWSYAFFMMPKLQGAVIPLELAQKIAWEGLDTNRELLQPYLKHAHFKSFFNVFSSTYNWTVAGAILIGLPAYGTYTYYDLKAKGTEQTKVLFTPMLDQSKQWADTNIRQMANEKTYIYFAEEFKNNIGRDPNAEELALLKKLRKN